jgi:broad specificity phosphatase PhoE
MSSSTVKTVYFVRHGETDLNREKRHQYPETPLSLKGREQAKQAAAGLDGTDVEIVLASDYVRAMETGTTIAKHLDIPIAYSKRLHEIRRPTALWGKAHYGLQSLWFFLRAFAYALVGNRRIDNEETIREFEERIGGILTMLEGRAEDRLAVVMTLLRTTIRHKGKAPPLVVLLSFLGMYGVDNAEITKAVFNGTSWHIEAANQNSHLE